MNEDIVYPFGPTIPCQMIAVNNDITVIIPLNEGVSE